MIGALTNAILDPLLIFGLGLGVRGAAIATVIAQCLMAVYVLFQLCRPEMPVRLRPHRLQGTVCRKIVAIGSMSFLITLLDNLIIISAQHCAAALRRGTGGCLDHLRHGGAELSYHRVLPIPGHHHRLRYSVQLQLWGRQCAQCPAVFSVGVRAVRCLYRTFGSSRSAGTRMVCRTVFAGCCTAGNGVRPACAGTRWP